MTELGAVDTGDLPSNWVPANTFADRLARLRRVMGWNFMEAGRGCGLSGKSWRLWEQHDRQPYNLLEVATKISEATRCSLVWLLTGSDEAGNAIHSYCAAYRNLGGLAASRMPLDVSCLVPAA